MCNCRVFINERIIDVVQLLPKEELYTPPIIIQVRDNRMFGRKPLVGVHTVKSVATFRLQAARTPRTGLSQQHKSS